MSNSYKIKEIADRSGFTATTVRYYEEIGLLPEATRNHAGYRLFDESTLDRLAFISRAKDLGCTLQEIEGLTLAWSGGRCGPIQEQLRTVVAEKLEAAQRQMVELATLTNELHVAADQLERHRPDGPCDDRCGCAVAPADAGTNSPREIRLGKKPNSATNSAPIACSLASAAVEDRLEDWQQMLTHAVDRQSMDDGLRVTFGPAPPLDDLMRLVSAEQDCCRFIDFAITVDVRGIALEVRSPAEALPVLHTIFGATT